jgi:outer membrane receptor protein involved in Fe transport
MKSILSAVVGATLALSAIEAGAQATPGERQVSLTIESDTLAAALDKWAQQSGFQIFVQDWEATKNLPARTLKGTFAAQDALEQLLSGTTLTYVWISDKAVSIRKKTAQTVPTALQRTSLDGEQGVPVAKFSGDDVGSAVASYAAAEESNANASDAKSRARVDQLEEVIVTGTYIRGAAPAGSPLRIYGRDEIDRSGAATLDQFARQMPENFAGVDPVANSNSSAALYGPFSGVAAFNAFDGAAFDLHGLGPTATLTLLDGRRLAAAGANGAMVDVSQVPLAAIDRIEVMTDGASAIYGADAVAGVVNIITRDDYDGAETRVRYGGATDDGADELTASQALGTSWDGGHVLLNYEYFKQHELEASQRDYIPDQGGPLYLSPEIKRNGAFLSVSQYLTDSTELSGRVIYTDRDTFSRVHAENIFSTADSALSTDVKQVGATVTLTQALAGDWSADLNGNYSQLRQRAVADSATSFGSLVQDQKANSDVTSVDLLASGTLFHVPAGALKAAIGASYREETFSYVSATDFGGFVLTNGSGGDLERQVKSAYAEVSVPILAGHGTAQSPPRLGLSAALRYDDYADVGSSTNSKLGVSWTPIPGLNVRGTYGTSFRAPQLHELRAPVVANTFLVEDPASSSGETDVILVNAGGNPALQPEESTSYTAGIDITPASLAGFSLGVTYFHIDFDNRIAAPPISGFNPLIDSTVAPFVDRSPTPEQIAAYFALPDFFDNAGLGPDGVEAIYDGRNTNIASTQQSGVDLFTNYRWDTALGRFGTSLSLSRLLHNDYQTVATEPYIRLLNTFAQPSKWKGRAGLEWVQGNLSSSVSVNYINSYDNNLGESVQSIDSWTTVDLYFSYATGERDTVLLDNMTIALAVNNATDKAPPLVTIPEEILVPGSNTLPFDAANASALGRFISLQITKRW